MGNVNEAHESAKRAAKIITGHTAADAIAMGAGSAALNMAFNNEAMKARKNYVNLKKKRSASKDDIDAARKKIPKTAAKAALRGFGTGAKYGALTGAGIGAGRAILDKTYRSL